MGKKVNESDFYLDDYKPFRDLKNYDIVVPWTFVEKNGQNKVLFAGCFKSFCVLKSNEGRLVSFAPVFDQGKEIDKVVDNYKSMLFLPIGKLKDVEEERQKKVSDFVIIGRKKWRIVGGSKMLDDVTSVYRIDRVFPFVHVKKLELKKIL